MEERKKPDERRGRKREDSDRDGDDYSPAVLKEGPRKYRFEDWASI